MKLTFVIGLPFIFMFFYSTGSAQSESVANKNRLIKAKIIGGDVFKPEEFQIDFNGQIGKADIHGHITIGQQKKSIDLGENFYTRKIHFYDDETQVIMFFEITDDEVGYNKVYCLNKQTLATIWKTDLQSFNLTVGQSDQGILYLSAGENAYALNIKTGKIRWQTNGFYHIYRFNYFNTISLVGSEIHLTGSTYSNEEKKLLRLLFLTRKMVKF